MKTLVDQLGQYAEYHRDRRNIATHFVGIPLIVVAVAVLLSRPGTAAFGLWLSPAALVSLASALYYFRLDLRYGLVMAVLLAISLWIGAAFAVHNPATEELIDHVPQAAPEDARRAIAAANTAFREWRRATAHDKAHMLHEVAAKLREHGEELATLMTLEGGKPSRWALA